MIDHPLRVRPPAPSRINRARMPSDHVRPPLGFELRTNAAEPSLRDPRLERDRADLLVPRATTANSGECRAHVASSEDLPR